VEAVPAATTNVVRLRVLCLGIAAAGLVADLLAKNAALALLDPKHPVPLLGGLVTLQLIRNPGAAFSMGESFTVVISLVGIAALIGVLVWFVPRIRHTGWAVAIGLLLAGIMGNLFDRLFREPGPLRGHVIDYIQLPYFAIFNVADICITAAAVMIVWLTVITKVSPAGVRLEDRDDAGDE
jgi:signal peptidase II